MDDGTNWTSIGMSNRTRLTRDLTSDMSMGAGHDQESHEEYPGRLSDRASDIGHRTFYGRWADDVEAGLATEVGQ